MPIPVTPRAAAPSSSDGVLGALTQAIVDGELAPGTRLNDADLAARYGAPRGAVRLALDLLTDLGLVRVEPRQYTEVAQISLQRVLDSVRVTTALGDEALRRGTALLTGDDRRALARYRATELDGGAAALLRVAEEVGIDYGVMSVVYGRLDDRELIRARSWILPYVRWASRAFGSRLDPTRERVGQTAVVEALIAKDTDGARDAWRRYRESVAVEAVGVEVAAAPDIDRSAPARRQTLLSEDATLAIRAAIVDGTLVPGEMLPETELMSWLNASRTPVRVALTRLAEQGFVDLPPRRRARVATIDPATVRDTLGTLSVLRRLAVRGAMARDVNGGLSTEQDLFGALDEAGGNRVERLVAVRFEARMAWFDRHGMLAPGTLDEVRQAITDGDADAAQAAIDAYYAVRAHPAL